ncbi:MAG: hypothetical protein ACPG77_18840, partial [Nannocystaceae bacterium]
SVFEYLSSDDGKVESWFSFAQVEGVQTSGISSEGVYVVVDNEIFDALATGLLANASRTKFWHSVFPAPALKHQGKYVCRSEREKSHA